MTRKTEKYSNQYLYRQLVQAKLFIDECFRENIDLSKIADKAHYSKFHFIRVFKRTYNLTPNQYLTRVRIEEACKLLKKDLSIKEVCMSVGFDSISTFKGLFKKITGNTLSSYQDQQLALQISMKAKPLKHIPSCLIKSRLMRKSNFQDPY